MKETNQSTSTPTAAEHDRTFDSGEPVGVRLKRSRLSQRKTHEEIARTTRIPASTLKAIEEGEYDKLPAEVFLRGFIRIYAQYLGLNADEALNCYFHQHGEGHDTSKDRMSNAQDFQFNDTQGESASFPLLRTLFIIFLLVLLLLLAYWGVTANKVQTTGNTQSSFKDASSFPAGDPLDQHDEVVPGGSETAGNSAADFTPHGETVAGTETGPAQMPAPADPGTASLPDNISGQRPGAGNTAAAVPGEPRVAGAETSSPPNLHTLGGATPAGKPSGAATGTDMAVDPTLASETASLSPAPLTINPDKQKIDLSATEYALKADFLEPTWLKIEIDGKRTREYSFKPGDHLSWRAQKSIRLVVGNAGGVSLTMNGEKLPPIGPSGRPATITFPKEVP